MRFTIDGSSATPAYEQIVEQVVAAIGVGRLAPGARLPTVRALAGEVGVAVNTVAKAYRKLEAEGHVRTLGRAGTVVADALHTPADRAVADAAAHLAAVARARGLDLDGALGAVRRAW